VKKRPQPTYVLNLAEELCKTPVQHASPMALDDAAKNGKLNENDLIFLITSGGGLSFAAAAFRY